jgi:hypothetical protein
LTFCQKADRGEIKMGEIYILSAEREARDKVQKKSASHPDG